MLEEVERYIGRIEEIAYEVLLFSPVDWKKWRDDQGCYLFAHIVVELRS